MSFDDRLRDELRRATQSQPIDAEHALHDVRAKRCGRPRGASSRRHRRGAASKTSPPNRAGASARAQRIVGVAAAVALIAGAIAIPFALRDSSGNGDNRAHAPADAEDTAREPGRAAGRRLRARRNHRHRQLPRGVHARRAAGHRADDHVVLLDDPKRRGAARRQRRERSGGNAEHGDRVRLVGHEPQRDHHRERDRQREPVRDEGGLQRQQLRRRDRTRRRHELLGDDRHRPGDADDARARRSRRSRASSRARSGPAKARER